MSAQPSAAPVHARSRSTLAHVVRRAAVGAVAGLAWAAALRAYMSEISGFSSHFDWAGTFVGVLLPGAFVGAVLGASSTMDASGRDRTALKWCAMAPLAFAIVPMLFPGALLHFLTQGLGGGAVAIALGAISGGYALGGTRRWARIAGAVLPLILVVGLASTVPVIGGARDGVDTARGWWAIALVASLMIVLVVAAAIPFRRLSAAAPAMSDGA